MSKIKYLRGLSTNLNKVPLIDGQIIFTTDTKEWYSDFLDDKGVLTRACNTDAKVVATALYNHLNTTHAPSNAEQNIIVGVKCNGTDVTVDKDRKVNIDVPTLSNFMVVSKTKPNKPCLWFNIKR